MSRIFKQYGRVKPTEVRLSGRIDTPVMMNDIKGIERRASNASTGKLYNEGL